MPFAKMAKPSALSAGEPRCAQAIGRALAPIVTGAAVLYNFVLCFVNTNLFGITPDVVVSSEIMLIAMAFGLIWNCSIRLYAILLLLAAYFFIVMLFRSQFDPKIVRDLLIPIVFFFMGRYLGSLRSADRLVTLLTLIALGAALFEWLAPDTYLRYFDVRSYYIARGTATEGNYHFWGGFFNSYRGEERTLLPFLGEHRVSGIFLEAPSVGNFAAVVFAWALLRDSRRFWALVAKSVVIAAMVVAADARFGLYFCFFIMALYVATPVIGSVVRPTMLFIAPFLAMIALVTYAGISWQQTGGNDLSGRMLFAGSFLNDLDPAQVFGMQALDIKSGVQFAMNAVTDSGYAYLLMEVGLLGMAAIWALFVYSPVHDRHAWRFKNVVAFYFAVLLTISVGVFTIKTAALLWFLYGTLNNPNRGVWAGAFGNASAPVGRGLTPRQGSVQQRPGSSPHLPTLRGNAA
jgi:putative polymerase